MSRNEHSVARIRRKAMLVAVWTAATMSFAAPAARGEIIYETEDPFGGPFGLWGYDVFIDQSVALRFTPGANYTLDRISLWFMNNDFSGQHHALVTVTLRNDNNDGHVSIPGDTIYETWNFNVSAVGWNPVLEVLDSQDHPLLEADVNYWIVAESDSPPLIDGVWNIASSGVGFMSNTDLDGEWYPGGMSAVTCTIVEGTRVSDLVGDLDGDCDVDLADLSILLSNYGTSSGADPGDGDLDGDGDVDLMDLAQLLASYGAEC
ncbi:MAG: hypothetical protein ACE5I3_13960 [Phycisphaerae bacterium]